MYRQAVCDNLQNTIWRLHGGAELQNEINHLKDETAVKPTEFKAYPHVVLMGDFNDEPFSSSLMDYLFATYDVGFVRAQKDLSRVTLYNASWEKLFSERPGTNYFEGSPTSRWSMLDQMMLSPSLLKVGAEKGLKYRKASFDLIQNLTATDAGIPFRSVGWDDEDNQIWTEGFSDHFPVTLELELVEE